MGRLKERRHLLLLVALVAVLIIQSFAHRLLLGPVASDAMVAVVMTGVFFVVFERPRERLLAVATLAAALAALLAHHALPAGVQEGLRIAYHALLVLFQAFAVAVILRDIFQAKAVRADDVLGAVCGYLLAAGAWSSLYALTEAFAPGSFTLPAGLAGQLDTWQGRTALFDYFSLVTLTTMGYGDISPVRPPATAFATLEAVFGQFYIAVIVAQLVGARLSQSADRRRADG